MFIILLCDTSGTRYIPLMAPEVIRNLYKAQGVFRCHHPAHRQFDHEVSPYHVLAVKRCYPQGCVEFLWRCRTLEKGHPCPRKFKHVGRGCFSCKEYHEDKLIYAPETSLAEDEIKEFIDELHQYEGWLESMEGKTIEFSGTVDAITPHFQMRMEERKSAVTMDGFYVSFAKGYIGRDLFDDRIYLKMSGNLLVKTRLAPDAKIDCRAIFSSSRGRIILRNPRQIEIQENGSRRHINVSRALVGRATGKIIRGPITDCADCPYISLVDVEDARRHQAVFYRRFYCLRGVEDSENCPVRLSQLLPGFQAQANHVRRF